MPVYNESRMNRYPFFLRRARCGSLDFLQSPVRKVQRLVYNSRRRRSCLDSRLLQRPSARISSTFCLGIENNDTALSPLGPWIRSRTKASLSELCSWGRTRMRAHNAYAPSYRAGIHTAISYRARTLSSSPIENYLVASYRLRTIATSRSASEYYLERRDSA